MTDKILHLYSSKEIVFSYTFYKCFSLHFNLFKTILITFLKLNYSQRIPQCLCVPQDCPHTTTWKALTQNHRSCVMWKKHASSIFLKLSQTLQWEAATVLNLKQNCMLSKGMWGCGGYGGGRCMQNSCIIARLASQRQVNGGIPVCDRHHMYTIIQMLCSD